MEPSVEVAIVIFLVVVFHFLIFYFLTRKTKSIDGKHVVVTGGSLGIGYYVAIFAARMGADVTIVARNVTNLEKAVAVIKENCTRRNQKIEYRSLDLSKGHEVIEKTFAEIEEKSGDIYMLVNCAGMAICGTIDDTKPEDARFLMDLNYFGTFFPTRYVLTKMKARKDGIIVLTSSQAGLLGMYGFCAYTATKFALRGLAEVLSMETKHLGITVTLAMPADTDTPGFANELKTKPQITKEISGSGGLFKAEHVAERIMKDALKGNFFSILGIESWILTVLCCGMSPWKNPLLVLLQFYAMGPLRLIGIAAQWHFGRIVKKHHNAKEKSK